ncbi:MAG: glycosyltransferase [Vampirovibrionales bacterium]|nr:glycosyltransferase [Vampirovibrionales bacterium]
MEKASAVAATPLVSVIMPAYNAARHIGEAIDSVRAQTYDHWELIIADDGSTDGTARIVAAYQDPRIRWIALPHCGVNMAVRNAALRAAEGAFIAFLDADDRYFPDALQTLASHLMRHSECAAVYGYFKLMDVNSAPLPMSWDHLESDMRGVLTIKRESLPSWDSLLWRTPKQLQSLMLRRDALARVGYFHEDMAVAEDTAFYIRLFLDDFDAVHTTPAYIFDYRVYPDSITHDEKRFQQVLQSIPRLYEGIFSHPKLPSSLRARQSDLCARHLGWFYARGRLQSGLKSQARRLVAVGWRYPSITRWDWARHCLPFWLLSYMPQPLSAALKSLRRLVKGHC